MAGSWFGDHFCKNQVLSTVDELLEFKGKIRHFEILFENVPPCRIDGFQKGDIDEDGVVDAEVLDEGGVDAIRIFIAGVYLADLVGGEDVSPLEDTEEDEGLDKCQQGYNSPESFLVELLFHICMIVWLTES